VKVEELDKKTLNEISLIQQILLTHTQPFKKEKEKQKNISQSTIAHNVHNSLVITPRKDGKAVIQEAKIDLENCENKQTVLSNGFGKKNSYSRIYNDQSLQSNNYSNNNAQKKVTETLAAASKKTHAKTASYQIKGIGLS